MGRMVVCADEKGLATTIVITTHYTEEAMQAHRVGKTPAPPPSPQYQPVESARFSS